MKLFAVALLLLPGLVLSTDICGDPSDPCMNEENWNHCMDLQESGCKNIAVLESCPLQFQCVESDYPDGCVSLYVYENKKCGGEPIRTLTFPTWTHPGSGCYHDATMTGYSVKNQYCNLDTGNWHQDVYIGDGHCEVPWYRKWHSPVELTYTTDSCVFGLKLKSCSDTPCDKSTSYYEIE